jgi:hypothetical protein
VADAKFELEIYACVNNNKNNNNNSDVYEGDFKEGLFHGFGIYNYKNGDRYVWKLHGMARVSLY